MLLLLDVDGPLNPWAARTPPPGYVRHEWRLSRWRRTTRHAWLNPAHGPALLALAERTQAELVWATSWEDLANRTIGPALGLPQLRVIGLRAYEGSPEWKYGAVGRFAAGQPLAWLDDDFSLFASARDAFLHRRREITALIPVDPAAGLTDAHLATAEQALISPA
ncbi:HAD domain-containing protein [Saccharothrix sp.]|uniref:HAD domain-containing protein n=1 Tax=Saccharothrix sp. TaxID=1873460 RepID=UPI0028119036|nr:HAD domain-containing protein [Saccharothrix sp.]